MNAEDVKRTKTAILNALPKSEDKAISGTILSRMMGMSGRTLRAYISELRIEYPICSRENGRAGYWLATTDKDIKACLKMLNSHKKSLENTIKLMEDQLSTGGL